jgi:hypothetical protein
VWFTPLRVARTLVAQRLQYFWVWSIGLHPVISFASSASCTRVHRSGVIIAVCEVCRG